MLYAIPMNQCLTRRTPITVSLFIIVEIIPTKPTIQTLLSRLLRSGNIHLHARLFTLLQKCTIRITGIRQTH